MRNYVDTPKDLQLSSIRQPHWLVPSRANYFFKRRFVRHEPRRSGAMRGSLWRLQRHRTLQCSEFYSTKVLSYTLSIAAGTRTWAQETMNFDLLFFISTPPKQIILPLKRAPINADRSTDAWKRNSVERVDQ